ncbi:hypothetical protein BDK89_4068 [Ilumatobacter fluminis]|uniref:Uncharacterized protein n=1 Tax=Ilumatobacter fluminis TaxID=467091 RepID=A0A4V3EJH5_9ACTN|nr:hypothetical protein [Ilumatobacter fluminis]TDT18448.1 hypothetical protein BDK89_4068 [Ilumatobacter fluminis]
MSILPSTDPVAAGRPDIGPDEVGAAAAAPTPAAPITLIGYPWVMVRRAATDRIAA